MERFSIGHRGHIGRRGRVDQFDLLVKKLSRITLSFNHFDLAVETVYHAKNFVVNQMYIHGGDTLG